METLVSASSWVEHHHVELVVVHDSEYVRMAADEEVRLEFFDQCTGARAVFLWIAAYVHHQHREAFAVKELILWAIETEVLVVGIAIDAFQGLECGYLAIGVEPPAEVAGMPYFVDGFKEGLDLVREHAMRV